MPDAPQQDPEPPYRLLFEGKENYLSAMVSGESVTTLDALDYALQMVQECRRRGLSRILYVKNIVGSLTVPGAVLASAGLRYLGLVGLAVAVVDLHMGYAGVNRTAEKVAARDGLQLRVFGSVLEAEAWLASLPAEKPNSSAPRSAAAE